MIKITILIIMIIVNNKRRIFLVVMEGKESIGTRRIHSFSRIPVHLIEVHGSVSFPPTFLAEF